MEFIYLGSHCSHPICNQQDFLPFECEGCRKKFCVDHRLKKDHGCQVETLGTQVFLCPICHKGIEIFQGETWDSLFATHMALSQCTPATPYKCPVKSCKTVLTHINSLTCPTCKLQTCLPHRYPDSHNCICEISPQRTIKAK